MGISLGESSVIILLPPICVLPCYLHDTCFPLPCSSVLGLLVVAETTFPLTDRSYTVNRMNSLKKGLRQVACLMSRYQAALLPRMLCAVLQTRSVNLQQWAAVLAGAAQPASHYRRLQRFLSGTWSPRVATQLIVHQLVKPGKPILLTLDRTHWQYGQTHHNLLCLGLVHQRVSIPLEYVALGSSGQLGSTADQRQVLDRALGYLPAERVLSVGRPRVYRAAPGCGICWSARWTSSFRLRCNHTIKRADGRTLSLARSTRNQAKGTTRVYVAGSVV